MAKREERKKLEGLAQREAQRVERINIEAIETPEQFQQAGELRREVKSAQKAINDAKRKIVDPLNEALRQVRTFFRPFEERCKTTLNAIDREMRDYERREQAKRLEEEQKLQALADKENEKLRKRAEKRAEKARASGDEDKAAEILHSVPELSRPTIVSKEVPKVQGMKRRSNWKARVANPKRQRELLQEAISQFNADRAPGTKVMPAQFWSIDEKALGAHARTTKGEVPIPGVNFYDETVYSSETG